VSEFREDEKHPGVWAVRTPSKPAFVHQITGEAITYAEVESLSNQVAHLARSFGLQRGDHAAVFLENRIDYAPIFWGFMRAGLKVTPIPTHLTPEEVDYILTDSGARLLVTSQAKRQVAEQLRGPKLLPGARFMLDDAGGGYASFEAALAKFPTHPIADQSEGSEMLYSSGTTGKPKGVLRPMSEAPFGTPTKGMTLTCDRWGITDETVWFHPAPMYHAAPIGYALRVMRWGGTMIVSGKFDPEQALATIEKHRVTHSQWVPTHFVRMLRLPEAVKAKYDLSSLRCAIHAAAPCPPQVKKAMIEWWGPVIEEYYAGSEANGVVTISSQEWLRKPGSVGTPILGRTRICDDDGNEVPAGTEGTIHFSDGPSFEYHNDPQKTADSRNAQGWTTLGDVGYVDADGYLFLTDRKTFMIVSGGVNIYPAEIENLLATHPRVGDVAVIGVPDEEFGESVKAVIELPEGVAPSPELAQEIIEFCRAHLSHVKCPRTVDFIDRLPRADNGKLYKRQLRDAYWKGRDRRIA